VLVAPAIALFVRRRASLRTSVIRFSYRSSYRLRRQLDDIDQKIALQLRAIEAGVDPNLVRERIGGLKTERGEVESELAALSTENHQNDSIDFHDACEILSALPDLGSALAAADPQTRRSVFDAFRLSVALDRNASQIHVRALVSSALTKAHDLQQLVTNGDIAGAGCGHISPTASHTALPRFANSN
jgi:hypothetical protein